MSYHGNYSFDEEDFLVEDSDDIYCIVCGESAVIDQGYDTEFGTVSDYDIEKQCTCTGKDLYKKIDAMHLDIEIDEFGTDLAEYVSRRDKISLDKAIEYIIDKSIKNKMTFKSISELI